ncbi:nucleoside hydrolase [Paenibacillus woosongensis]|uniref:Nucleoside hydrolase n=1 Tax=Paenibacillus woosongensis TaxID=307580 RepID=A0A7X2Z277_9BACL|nr:nucleoside hydrolase [Paenibacillus woosongensis]MUG46247.1 nucleoside hydrolase [Paenibacillus woosongensis]
MKPVIMDVDTGIDDALAIAYAAHSPELELIALTTCFGNIPAKEATRNSLYILDKLGKSVPVYEGAELPVNGSLKKAYARHIHGEDGLGNTLREEPQGHKAELAAVDYIIRQVKERPHEMTIIAVGPLTNLALAIEKAPEIIPLIGEVIVMGGAVTVPGNVTPYGEANIVADPEAAAAVFTSGVRLTLVGLDVTMQTLLSSGHLQKWRHSGGELGGLLAEMTEFYIGAYEARFPGIGGCGLHDPLAVGVAIDRSFVSTERMRVAVVTEGEASGQTVGSVEGEPRIEVCTKVDADRFLQHFLSRVI